MPERLRSFPALLVAIVGLAFAVRVLATLAGYQNLPLGLDDNNWYHTQSLLLADHGDLYDPFACLDSVREPGMSNDQAVALCREEGVLEPSAGHPPGYLVYLAGVAKLGFETPLEQRIAGCLLGALAVAFVGLVGRQVAGRRAGLIAALLAAVYPNLWINDGLILAESLYTVFVGVVLLLCYRLWRSPTWGTAALLGVAIAAATLTRSEGLTFLAFVVLPLLIVLPGVTWGRKAGLAVVTGVVTLALMAPWVAHNLNRFTEPVYLASGTGRVMAYGNCDATYYGDRLGYWDDSCTLKDFPDGDESVVDSAHRELATDYMSENTGRLPVVVAARIGRMWSVYAPIQGANLDILFERRGAVPVRTGLAMYYGLLALSVVGLVVLFKRKVTIIPFVGIALMITFTAAASFGVTRYRTPVDLILPILAAVALDAWWSRGRGEAQDVVEPGDAVAPEAMGPEDDGGDDGDGDGGDGATSADPAEGVGERAAPEPVGAPAER